MAFLRHLKEKLEAQKIYDCLKGKYQTDFKVEGSDFSFIATSIGGDENDATKWMLEFENVKSHRIGVGDGDNKVVKAFAEAVDGWVKEKQPHCFYTYGSHIDSIKSIIEAVKKKIKKYNVKDETEDTKLENKEVIEGNPLGMITWTKMMEEETITSEEKANTKMDKNEEVFDTYEEPVDSKAKKEFTSGTSKKDKLDNGDGSYDIKTEFRQFKQDMLSE
jgi:hypothetical protein